MSKILLMGNPNVGKSVFFTELTGVHAVSSNYAGTTVTFTAGQTLVRGAEYTLIDVPGTYSMKPTSEAEAVAARFMADGADALICVLDASNLERNLCFALELRKFSIPAIYILNLTDVAERKGIFIDAALLEKEMAAPVISTIAVKKPAIAEIKSALEKVLFPENAEGEAFPKGAQNAASSEILPEGEASPEILAKGVQNAIPEENFFCGKCATCYKNTPCDIPTRAREIAHKVTRKNLASPSFLDRLGEAMLKPWPGIFIAFLVMALAVCVVVFGGRGLRAAAFLPLVRQVIVPFFERLFTGLLPEGISLFGSSRFDTTLLLNILVGEFGIFVISFEWILALIFPYVLLFYVVFGFLEDTGFLPRLSVLFDNIMRKLGVQGGSLIHMIMGYGCAVPAIIGSRAATSRKERIVISAAVCFAIPCISQTGALISLFSAFAWWLFPAMVMFSLVLFVAVTIVAGKFVKGEVEPLLIEVPNLLLPAPKSYGRKIFTRMKHFLREAEVPMMIAVLIAAILAETGLLESIAYHARPVVSGWLGLPEQAVVALILGIVRREMSAAPLIALDLTALQAFVGGVVSLMYLPCISVFAILAKEFKIKVALVISLTTIVLALFTGGLIFQIASLLGGA